MRAPNTRLTLIDLRCLDAKVDTLVEVQRDPVTRVGFEEQQDASLSRRVDRAGARLDRIERRLDLIEPPRSSDPPTPPP